MNKFVLFFSALIFSVCIPVFSGGESQAKSDDPIADEKQAVASMANPSDLIISTTPTLEGYRIKEYKGVVRGVIVRQPTIGQGLSANLERMKGGKISAYTVMCESTRQQAFDLCVTRARALGANALVGMQYDSSAFNHADNVASEVICYGTAVLVEKLP